MFLTKHTLRRIFVSFYFLILSLYCFIYYLCIIFFSHLYIHFRSQGSDSVCFSLTNPCRAYSQKNLYIILFSHLYIILFFHFYVILFAIFVSFYLLIFISFYILIFISFYFLILSSYYFIFFWSMHFVLSQKHVFD